MGQYCCCGPCCYFRGWPSRHITLSPPQGFFFSVRYSRRRWWMWGQGEKRNRNRVWMRDGNLVKWVMAAGHAHKRSNKNKRKHGFTNRHTRQKTVTIPLVFQLLTFPARPQIRPAQPTGISPLLHFTLLLLGRGFGCGASEAPGVPQGGSSPSTLPAVSLGEVGFHMNIPLQMPT